MAWLLKLVDANNHELIISIDDSVRELAGQTGVNMETLRYIGVQDRDSGQDVCGVTLANEQEIMQFLMDNDQVRAKRVFRSTTKPEKNFTREEPPR